MLQSSSSGRRIEWIPEPGIQYVEKKRSSGRWSLISEVDEDNKPDEHEEFIRSVRCFQCTLLMQFRTGPSSPTGSRQPSGQEGKQGEPLGFEAHWGTSSSLDRGEEPYLARFAQPYPARPIWAALPRPSLPGRADAVPGGEAWASDYSCAPQVCVVLRGALKMRSAVHGMLSKLAQHPLGLLVTINPKILEDGKSRGLVLLAVVGLKAPRKKTAAAKPRRTLLSPKHGQQSSDSLKGQPGEQPYTEEDILSEAEQREMVWAGVHEALWDSEGELPEVVIEVFMLQDIWLYDRLFQWLAKRSQRSFWKEPLQQISQEELDLIVHQFGEETATHFLFVQEYMRHLRVAAVVATSCIVVSQLAQSGLVGEQPLLEKGPWMLLAAFLPTWGFHFQASWRATASKAGFRWLGSLGSVQNSVKEVARLQSMESTASKRKRYLWVTLLAVPLMCFQLLVVLGVTVTFVVIEICLYDFVWETMSMMTRVMACVIYNLAFGIAFMLTLGIFHPISKTITKWEGHPNSDLERWHLTAKIYANWFFAIFLYFFVLAFGYVPFGHHIAGFFSHFQHDPSLAHEGARLLHEATRNATLRESVHSSIRQALLEFHPDASRLTVDVLLFFVLQDLMRLSQVLIPVFRAFWGLAHLRSRSKGQPQHQPKRTAVVSGLGAVWHLCFGPRGAWPDDEESATQPWRKSSDWMPVDAKESSSDMESEEEDTDAEREDTIRSQAGLLGRNSGSQEMSRSRRHSLRRLQRSQAPPRSSAASMNRRFSQALLPPRTPATPFTRKSSEKDPSVPPHMSTTGCLVAYFFAERVYIDRTEEPNMSADTEVLMLACSLSKPGDEDSARAESRAAQLATSRLRTCYANDMEGNLLEEEPNEELGDLFTLTCENTTTSGADSQGAVILNVLVELLQPEVESADGMLSTSGLAISRASRINQGQNSWGCQVELGLKGDGGGSPNLSSGALLAKDGIAKLGPVRVQYFAGLVRAASHHEALERVPRALRRAREGLPLEGSAAAPPQKQMAFEEARALLDRPDLPQDRAPAELPWVWWDEELARLYWEEVFELFAVKETFETFEIYAHLATSFSYVCLFGVTAPLCPLLAMFFTAVEVRQDQLRLLWLSRPPHPDEETLRFKWRVSLGAWYEIIRFTCHLSVVINLLLWGLTYEGLGGKPANWSTSDWWRALALFLLTERVAIQLSKLLHAYVSQLDHETASAYLRRYKRLRRAFNYEEEDDTKLATRSSRQLQHESCRRRLTRIPSKGLSSLV